MKILVVEDDPDISDLLKRVLESDGYEVEMATDSAGALRAVAEGPPDLVLLDVVLGGEDGRDLLVKLREKSDVPAVFLTGRGLEGDRIAGLRMGAGHVVDHAPELTQLPFVLWRKTAEQIRHAGVGVRFVESVPQVNPVFQGGDELADVIHKRRNRRRVGPATCGVDPWRIRKMMQHHHRGDASGLELVEQINVSP